MASNAKGRGVLRLLLTQHRIDMVCIPLICIQALICANQSWMQYLPICYCFEILATIVVTNLSFSGFSVAFGRLFYVNQDTAQAYITEDSFFSGISTLHVTYSGIVVAMSLGESVFTYNDSHTTFVWYSFCSNTPFVFAEQSFSYYLQVVINMLIFFTTFVSHIVYFYQKRQIEVSSEGSIATVESFNLEDGVTVIRKMDAQPSRHYLRNFHRTVVSPKASLVVFIMITVSYCILGCFYLNLSTTGLPIGGQFILFVTFCKTFFLDSLIVTYFSPTVWDSLFQCHGHSHHVNV